MITLDRLEAFIGNVARPLSIFVATVGTTVSGVIIARKVENGNDGAIFIGALGAYAAGLFLAKAVEVWKGSKDHANVEIAKAVNENPANR